MIIDKTTAIVSEKVNSLENISKDMAQSLLLLLILIALSSGFSIKIYKISLTKKLQSPQCFSASRWQLVHSWTDYLQWSWCLTLATLIHYHIWVTLWHGWSDCPTCICNATCMCTYAHDFNPHTKFMVLAEFLSLWFCVTEEYFYVCHFLCHSRAISHLCGTITVILVGTWLGTRSNAETIRQKTFLGVWRRHSHRFQNYAIVLEIKNLKNLCKIPMARTCQMSISENWWNPKACHVRVGIQWLVTF